MYILANVIHYENSYTYLHIYTWLVVWNIFYFCTKNGNLIFPTDDLSIIFQRGRWLNHQVTISREAWDRSLVPTGGERLQICELENHTVE